MEWYQQDGWIRCPPFISPFINSYFIPIHIQKCLYKRFVIWIENYETQFSPGPITVILRRQKLGPYPGGRLIQHSSGYKPRNNFIPWRTRLKPIYLWSGQQYHILKDQEELFPFVLWVIGIGMLVLGVDAKVARSSPSWLQSGSPWRLDHQTQSKCMFWKVLLMVLARASVCK